MPTRGFAAMLGHRRGKVPLSGRLRSYRPGAVLLGQGDDGGLLLAVHSGRVGGDADGTKGLLALRGAAC